MNDLTDTHENIIQEHSALIHLVIGAIQNPQQQPVLDGILAQAEENGWANLVQTIRKILGGQRNLSDFGILDDEDRCVVIAILRGLEDQTALPDLAGGIDAKKAAVQIATLMLAVRCGNAQAGQSLSNMAAKMMSAGGDMAQIGAVLGYIINGERRLEKLSYNMGSTGEAIVRNILAELEKREIS
jgi:Trp operon repressor